MSEAVKPLTVPRELLGPPGDFNPTLLMFGLAIGLAAFATLGYFNWHWYRPCVFVLNMLALHLVGTVIHDACHNVAHRDRVLNAMLGHASAMMLCFSFPVFTRVHMQHHANVNDPHNDPDHVVSTWGPLWIINARFMYHEVYFFSGDCGANGNCWNGRSPAPCWESSSFCHFATASQILFSTTGLCRWRWWG